MKNTAPRVPLSLSQNSLLQSGTAESGHLTRKNDASDAQERRVDANCFWASTETEGVCTVKMLNVCGCCMNTPGYGYSL